MFGRGQDGTDKGLYSLDRIVCACLLHSHGNYFELGFDSGLDLRTGMCVSVMDASTRYPQVSDSIIDVLTCNLARHIR